MIARALPRADDGRGRDQHALPGADGGVRSGGSAPGAPSSLAHINDQRCEVPGRPSTRRPCAASGAWSAPATAATRRSAGERDVGVVGRVGGFVGDQHDGSPVALADLAARTDTAPFIGVRPGPQARPRQSAERPRRRTHAGSWRCGWASPPSTPTSCGTPSAPGCRRPWATPGSPPTSWATRAWRTATGYTKITDQRRQDAYEQLQRRGLYARQERRTATATATPPPGCGAPRGHVRSVGVLLSRWPRGNCDDYLKVVVEQWRALASTLPPWRTS